MSEKLFRSQIVGLKPNNSECIDATNNSKSLSPSFYGFASEHICVIYDRYSLNKFVIETPDPTSNVVAICFRGDDNLYCCNSKGKLFKYSLKDYKEPIDSMDIGCVCTSMSASEKYIFIISGPNIFLLDAEKEFKNAQMTLLTDTQSHLELSVAPSGRALASYKLGCEESHPTLWFAPFQKHIRYILPTNIGVNDFQWGLTSCLSAVTAGMDNVVRLWRESQNGYQMQCIAFYQFDVSLRNVSYCMPTDIQHLPYSFDEPPVNKLVKARNLQPPALILATVENETVILEQTKRPLMRKIGVVKLPDEESVSTKCDVRYIFAGRQVKKMLMVTRFSLSSISFFHLELGDKGILFSVPLSRPFIRGTIKKVFENEENKHLISESTNGFLFDWTDEKEVKGIINKSDARVTKSQNETHISLDGKEDIKIDYKIENIVENKDNEHRMAVCYSKDKFSVIHLIDNKHKEIEHETIDFHGESITHATIHSPDIFAISTEKTVYAFLYQHMRYELIAKRENMQNPLPIFIPHTLVLLAIHHSDVLEFFIVKRSNIQPIQEFDKSKNYKPIKTTELTSMNVMKDKSIFVSTQHALFRLEITNEDVPQPVFLDEKVIYTTATLSFFNSLSKIMQNEVPNSNDYLTNGDPDNVQLSQVPETLPKGFIKLCKEIPQLWKNLDKSGMRYLYCNILSKFVNIKEYLPLFGIWGLLSKKQHILVEIMPLTSIEHICRSMLPLWAKDTEIINVAIGNFLAKNQPMDNEVDEFILLCVCTGKKIFAKKIASSTGQEKLAHSIEVLSNGKMKEKTAKSGAYRALREHRPALSALFFYMSGDVHSAIRVLHETPMFMLLVARLTNDKLWEEIAQTSFDDICGGFYTQWWLGDKEKAAECLAKLEINDSPHLSVEFHRYEILMELGRNERSLVLNLQPYALFVPSALSIIENNADFDEVEEAKEEVKEESKEEEEDIGNDFDFDFGGQSKNWDDFSDDYSSSYDTEEEAEDEEKPQERSFVPPKVFSRVLEETEIQTTLKESFMQQPLVETHKSLICQTENYIVSLIACLINGTGTREDVNFIAEICRNLFSDPEKHAEAYTLTFILMAVLRNTNLIVPLMDGCFDSSMFDIFLLQSQDIKPSLPDLLSTFKDHEISITENDIKLTMLIAANKLTHLLRPELHSPLSPILSFMHLYHRKLFSSTNKFQFSSSEFETDISPVDQNSSEVLVKMRDTKLTEDYRISVGDDFVSPFFPYDEFIYTRSFPTRSRCGSHVRGIAINPLNNKNVVVVSKKVVDFHITQEDLDTNFEDATSIDNDDEWAVISIKTEEEIKTLEADFDSPLSSFLKETPTTPDAEPQNARLFHCSWDSERVEGDDVKALCVAANPCTETFITGDTSGRVHLWNFGENRSKAVAQYSDSSIIDISYNSTGDRFVYKTQNGDIIVSNFNTAERVLLKPNTDLSVSWLNTDTQLVLAGEDGLSVVDLLSGQIVADMEHEIPHTRLRPLSVWGSNVAVGTDSGEILVFDVRMGKALEPVNAHTNEVRALQYDKSGSYLISGSLDNTVCILNSHEPHKFSSLPSILGDGSSVSKRGVLSLAVSNQVIVAGGYSPIMHSWTVSEPQQ